MKNQSLLASFVVCTLLYACAVPPQIEADVKTFTPSLHYFDCDALPGKISRSMHRTSEPISFVEGEYRINEAREHSRWAPLVGVGLLTAGGEYIFQVKLSQSRQPIKVLAFLDIGSGDEFERNRLAGEYSLGQVVPFKIAILDAETAAFQIGTDEQAYGFQIKGTPRQLQLSCSTAWAEINIHEVRLRTR